MDGDLNFRVRDLTYVRDDLTYARKIDQATKNLLTKRGIPLASVNTAISNIKPPEVPDAPTIYASLGSKAAGVTEEMFAKLLFLLACAGISIGRSIHVHYHVD